VNVLLAQAREDLERSVTDSLFSDMWSDAASRVYFDCCGVSTASRSRPTR